MPAIVGVKFRFSPKPVFYSVDEPAPESDARVVVKTDRGQELGQVVAGPQEPDGISGPGPFDRIERVASEDDLRAAEELEEREREALRVYREFVKERGLDMKPIGVEYLFDGSKVVFYFVAEERVDFRDLVRDLANRFHARIDMRQVGVRDEARMVGGLGHCGEQLCCSRFGGDFQPVSIRMAKEQDLPLNPLKISGLCGRLMCCLRYEYDAYKEFKGRAPRRNSIVETPTGPGKVIDLNVPKEMVTLLLEGGGRMEVPLASMDCACDKGCPCRVKAEALPQPEEPVLVAAGEVTTPLTVERQPRGERKPRRRRGGGGGGGGGAADGAGAKQQQADAPPRQQPAENASGGEPKAPGTGRRRRRRRPPQGGGTG